MPTFTGQLSIIGHQSNLDDNATDWLLLMAGIADPAQATFTATQFLVKVKKLHSGQIIQVVGSSALIGSVSIISMTNASPAGPQAIVEVAGLALKPTTAGKKTRAKSSSSSKVVKSKPGKKTRRKAPKK